MFNLFSRALRPKLKIEGGPVYGLGPLPDTWGAARLIYEKQLAYPIDARFGAGIVPTVVQRIGTPWRLTQPAPPLVLIRTAFVTGISGVPTGSYYSTPASLVSAPGDYKG